MDFFSLGDYTVLFFSLIVYIFVYMEINSNKFRIGKSFNMLTNPNENITLNECKQIVFHLNSTLSEVSIKKDFLLKYYSI